MAGFHPGGQEYGTSPARTSIAFAGTQYWLDATPTAFLIAKLKSAL
jgi:hypothetical protein